MASTVFILLLKQGVSTSFHETVFKNFVSSDKMVSSSGIFSCAVCFFGKSKHDRGGTGHTVSSKGESMHSRRMY